MEQGKHIRMLQHQDRKNNNSVANIGRKKGYSVGKG